MSGYSKLKKDYEICIKRRRARLKDLKVNNAPEFVIDFEVDLILQSFSMWLYCKVSDKLQYWLCDRKFSKNEIFNSSEMF